MSPGVLYRARGPVTLIGGGPVAARDLAAALALAPEAVAADSGADVALPAGVRLGAVIGDLDSVADVEAHARAGVAVHRVAEQDSTDLEKCLRAVAAPMLLGVGFLGGRLDHQLAAMSALVKHARRPAVLIGEQDLCFLSPPVLALEVGIGSRVSLFPLVPVTGTVSEGLHWPVAGLALRPDAAIGTSNRAIAPRVRFGFDAAGVIVILPKALLPEVAAVLPGAWE